MGVGGAISDRPKAGEGKLSVDAEGARPPSGGRAGRRALAAGAVAAALAVAACGGGASATLASSPSGVTAMQTTPAPQAQTLSETGSSLMAPLFALWGPAPVVRLPLLIGRLDAARSRRYAE
jgi:hypothetical protein